MRYALMIAAAFAVFGAAAAQECEAPATPSFDARLESLSQSDMVKMFRSVKSFQAMSANYRDCLAAQSDTLDAQALAKLHNASVDAEEAVASQFNRLFHAFKERSQAAR